MKLRELAISLALFAGLMLGGTGSVQAAPQKFGDGLHNLPTTHWMFGRDVLEMPYPARWAQYFDDFHRYTAGDWTITTTEAGAGSATEVISDADNGVLLITNAAGDDDLDFFQSDELFTFEAGSQLYFEARIQFSDATQSDFIMGLQVTDTTPLAVADGVYFQKDDGDTNLDFHSMSSSVDSASTAIQTVADATFYVISFYWDGVSSIAIAVDDTLVATLSNVTPPTTELTVSFGVQNGEAVAKTFSVDYIFIAEER